MAAVNLYRGDIVRVRTHTRAWLIVREIDGGRIRVQNGRDAMWLLADDLIWDGESLVRLPRTNRGWRRLGAMLRWKE